MQVRIINEKGLHARASAKLAELCETFKASIQISYDGITADGSSIMGLMMLGAAKGAEIDISAEGEDAEAAQKAVIALIEDYFGEGQ